MKKLRRETKMEKRKTAEVLGSNSSFPHFPEKAIRFTELCGWCDHRHLKSKSKKPNDNTFNKNPIQL
jgi:hypothetical protein